MSDKVLVVRDVINSAMGEALLAKEPVGGSKPQQAAGQGQTTEKGEISVGVWESSPGVFRRTVVAREFSHIVSGWCIFTPDGQEPIELRAGDAVYFPARTEGVWDVREHLRKSYAIF